VGDIGCSVGMSCSVGELVWKFAKDSVLRNVGTTYANWGHLLRRWWRANRTWEHFHRGLEHLLKYARRAKGSREHVLCGDIC
jgi:hypothetical protein